MERIRLSTQFTCAAKSISWIGVEAQTKSLLTVLPHLEGYQTFHLYTKQNPA